MEHFGFRKLEYIKKDNKIITLSFEAGRQETNSIAELEKRCKEVFNKELLSIFYNISSLIDSDNGKSSFDFFTDDLLYAVQYNLKKENTTYYHEIDKYEIKSGNKIPIIQKILKQKDKAPCISVDIDENQNLTIKDWCGFYTPSKSHQEYTYKPAEGTITFESGTDETGKYIILTH